MKKRHIFTLTLATLSLVSAAPSLSFAKKGTHGHEKHDDHHDHDHHGHDHHDDHHGKTDHYAGQEFKSEADAKKGLHALTAKIEKLAEKKSLLGSDLEAIHEISYSLENAIDFLIEHKAASQALLEATDEAIQAIHHASEDHEEAKTRKWLKKLRAAVDAL